MANDIVGGTQHFDVVVGHDQQQSARIEPKIDQALRIERAAAPP